MEGYEAWLLSPDGIVVKRVPIEARAVGDTTFFSEPDFGMPVPRGYTVVQGKPAEIAQDILRLHK